MKRYLAFGVIVASALCLSAQDYNSLHNTLIKFYGYQRAGLKTGSANNLNSGWANASHNGDNYNSNPLDGGWYDAGDYIKFGMPLSYTVYCLLKGYDLFPGAYADTYKADHSSGTDNIPDVLNQVKFATDYMIKAVISETQIILDVGIASVEHTAGMQRANNTAGRSAGDCRLCSGADIPATYAACLALMSTLYKKYDEAYSKQCLDKAVVAFKFAKNKYNQGGDNNLYSTPQKKDNKALYDYYTPDGGVIMRQINDRLVAAGVELYRATKDADPIYRTWAKKSIIANYNCMSYSFIGPLASIEVWRQGLSDGSGSVATNVGFVDGKIGTTGFYTGVYKNSGWGTARDAGTAAFVYALGYITEPSEATRTKYLQKIKDNVGFVAGTFGTVTKRSYIIGYGSPSPSSIHYRTSPSGPQGGVVSGPDDEGKWENDGTKYQYTEVALDYNAGIVGAVGFLKALATTAENEAKMSAAFNASIKTNVDFSKDVVKFSATLSKALPWTITISGGFGTKKFTGTTAAISADWDGSADEGLFLSGETVAAKLEVEGTIVVYDLIKARALTVSITSAKKPAKAASDVLVDDFEDGTLNGTIAGTVWVPFGTDSSFANKTTTMFTTFNASKALQANCTVLKDGEATYAGLKLNLKADGSASTIGSSKTIVFDLKGNKEAMVNVELEQASITDGAYYSMQIPVTTLMNTYRLDIAKFKQSAWKTAEKPLDVNAIKSIRFTVYDSTGLILLVFDNVYIDSFSSATVTSLGKGAVPSFAPAISGGVIRFTMPFTATQPLTCMVFDVAGRSVLSKTYTSAAGSTIMLPIGNLASGVYTLTHSVNGVAARDRVVFTQVR